MHVHLLGICGTFMGGLALIARELGHRVTGSDTNVYPPMSTQLAAEGVEIREGYLPAHLDPAPDLVVVGNALSRGNPCIEALLDSDQEVAMGFTDSGAGVIRIEGMGYFDPDIVTFYGTDGSGARTQLVQHVTQLNVLLRAVPKPQEADAPRRIGFHLAQSLEES